MRQFFTSVWGVVIGAVVIVVIGSAAGYFLSQRQQVAGGVAPEVVRSGNVVGLSEETKKFTDSAVGVLQDEGLNGEGTHHLVLDSNPKNSAYLVSSVVDLDEFIGKHIEVWGETMQANKVPWLMDVGRVKMLD